MSMHLQSTQSSDVLFWEGVLEIELRKAASLLEKKQTRLVALRNLPFNAKSESTNRTVKALEEELSVFVGLIGIIDELRKAYVEFTASVADKLVSLAHQCDFYRRELIESMVRGGAYRP